eukprot:COSAG02_NODE_18851_length_914_cov_1.101840_2_plen_120_part_00
MTDYALLCNSAGTEGLLEYEPRLRAESVDLHTLKELEVDDLKHFGIPVGPARRIFNVLRRHREDDLSVVVRTMKTQVATTANQKCLCSTRLLCHRSPKSAHSAGASACFGLQTTSNREK